MLVAARRASVAILVLCSAGAASAQVQPAPNGTPIVVEGHAGMNDPLGTFGLAVVYDRGGRLSAGLGLGADSNQGKSLLTTSLFGRARFLRKGPFALDLGAIFSRGGNSTERTYGPPSTSPYLGATLIWNWNPSYRATGTLAAELANRRWSLRLEAGLAYLLNHPTCTYEGSGPYFTGDCNSPQIPSPYHFTVPPGQIVPSLTVTLGYRLGVDDPDTVAHAAAGDEYRSPGMALRLSALSTVVPMLVGATMITAWENSGHDNSHLLFAGIAGLALGLSFGPSIGYAYAGEHFRGWGMGLLRLVGSGAGVVAIFAGLFASIGEDEGSSSSSAGDTAGLIAVVAFTPVLVSAVYDIFTAPRAARRANEQHGLTNLSLVPVPIPGRSSASPGLALVGQF